MTRHELITRLQALLARGCFLPDARELASLILKRLLR